MNTLILSDLHLGARNSRTDLLLRLLDEDFDRLVLNGDVVDRPDPSRFRPADQDVLARLREVARECELVVVRGNHDALRGPGNARGRTDFLAGLLGVPVLPEYVLEVGGERYLVVHGDQFDGTMNLTWVGDAADSCYRGIQRVSRRLAHWVKGASKHVCGVVGAVQNGALAQARRRGFDGIITGHTHFCHDEEIDGIHYLNTGCWVDAPCSGVWSDADGVRLVFWGEKAAANPVRREVAVAACGAGYTLPSPQYSGERGRG
jgi:UDP-2,3-diacylglucosamine pyrophosphatase LpxH